MRSTPSPIRLSNSKMDFGSYFALNMLIQIPQKKAIKRATIREREKREALVAKINPGLGNKYSKEKAMKKLEEAEKHGKVVTIKSKEKDQTVKTSKAFFTSLQDEVKTHGKEKP